MPSKKQKALTVIQTIGRSFFLPISILPVAGLLLGTVLIDNFFNLRDIIFRRRK